MSKLSFVFAMALVTSASFGVEAAIPYALTACSRSNFNPRGVKYS